APVDVTLDPRSLTTPGQVVDGLPHSGVTITITAVGPRPGGTDTGPSAVGFADLGLGANREVVDVPTGVLDRTDPATPVAVVLSRERTDPLDRWRSDPEPLMVRRLALPRPLAATAAVTLRLDRRASDSVLAGLTGQGAALADRRLTGNPDATGWHAVDGDPATAWTSPFVDPVGSTLTVALDPAVPAGSLTIHQAVDDVHSTITLVRVTIGDRTVELPVPAPDASGASTVALPDVAAPSMTLSVAAIDPNTTVDRRYGEVTTLPVAITELDSPAIVRAPAVAPAQPACRDDLLSVDGTPVPLAVDATQVAALVAGQAVTVGTCDGSPLDLAAGTHVVASTGGLDTGIDVDRVVLSSGTPSAPTAAPAVTVRRSDFTRTATVAPCPNGCWL